MVTVCQLLKKLFEVPDLHRQRRLSNRAGGRGPPEMPVLGKRIEVTEWLAFCLATTA